MNSTLSKDQPTNQSSNAKINVYRFDVFRGKTNEQGKVEKIASVGHGTLYEGSATYTIYLKTFLKDQFYLLPERDQDRPFDLVILTREPSSLPGKKYFWNRVGTAKLLSDKNAGLMRLDFDLFGAEIYLSFHDSTVKEQNATAA